MELRNDGVFCKSLKDVNHFNLQCSNAMKQDSHGCKSYIRTLIEKYVTKYLSKDYSKEEKKFDPLSLTHSESQPQKEKKSKSNKGPIGYLKNFFSTTVDDEALSQLVEMGFDVDVATPALKKSGSDIHKALDILREQSYNGEIGYNPAQDFKIGSQYLPETHNKLIQMLLFLSDSLEKASRNCFICLDELEGDSIKLRTCTKDYCEYS